MPELPQSVIEHLNNHSYQIDTDISKLPTGCIDERYQPEDGYILSIPGADIGQLAVMMSANKTAQLNIETTELINSLIQFVDGPAQLRFHTDDHGDHTSLEHKGCGHWNLVSNQPELYGLEQQHVDLLQQFMAQALADGAESVVLRGDHDADGIIINTSTEFSFYNRSEYGSFFVMDIELSKLRHQLIATLLADNDAIESSEISTVAKAFDQTMEAHLMTTAQNLGASAKLLDEHLVFQV